MNILGLTHPMAWNNAACLISGGTLVEMVEEERLNRFKQSHGIAPNKAVEHCLETAGIHLDDVDFIAVGWDPEIYRKRKEKLIWDYQFRQLPIHQDDERVRFLRHHITHAASAFYPSPFDTANIITLDGRGEQEAGLLALGRDDDIEIIHAVPLRESWGYVYGKLTEALGFVSHRDEGKVMGLSAYGEPDLKTFDFIDWDDRLPYISKRRFRRFLTRVIRRARNEEINDEHRNLAATLQAAFQKGLLQMAEFLYGKTQVRNFCLAGGCALNCSANGALLRCDFTDHLFVQPASHDAGTALGAALQVYRDIVGIKPDIRFDHAFHGPGFDADHIEELLLHSKMSNFRRLDNVEDATADLLTRGNVVAWFQGRMEVGPRALGGRSILADPRDKALADRVNRIKGREPWRPLAPSMLEEEADKYFERWCHSPFMLLAFQANEKARAELPGVVHHDGSVRAQIVKKEIQPRFARLLEAFRERTGVGAVLNTSFNVGPEPIVCTPRDGLMSFYSSDLDALVIGNWIIEKRPAR